VKRPSNRIKTPTTTDPDTTEQQQSLGHDAPERDPGRRARIDEDIDRGQFRRKPMPNDLDDNGARGTKPFRLEPGRNCWRIENARRFAVVVDGEEYFAELRQSLIGARRCIAISAWDIHSRVALVRPHADAAEGDVASDGLPTTLGDLLLALLRRDHALHVYLLLWGSAPIYALEREVLIFGDAPWGAAPWEDAPWSKSKSHPRLHFIKDSAHPLAASQHQKIVAIDGRIAWCGGFDVSKSRWDTQAHLAQEARRRDPDGKPYPPFHDIQMLVDGDAAKALTQLFRERWLQAGGQDSGTLAAAAHARFDFGFRGRDKRDPWPNSVEALLRDQRVAIARTLPAHRGRAEVREVEALYLDIIAGAGEFLFIENQYLTSRSIADALGRSLQREHGPQILMVLPRETGDWLEKHTMDILRARILAKLREADRYDRLRVYYPDVPGLGEGCMMVHAKLIIADDRVLRIGSSNLSNRSMGLDSECDLCIVAASEDERRAITGLRRRLLAMFLSVTPDQVAAAEASAHASGGGLNEAIDSLCAPSSRSDEQDAVEGACAQTNGNDTRQPAPKCGPRLAWLDGHADPEWDRQLPDERLIDPDRPIEPDLVTDLVVGKENTPHLRKRLWAGVAIVGLLLALAATWRWTPLGQWLDPQVFADTVRGLSRTPWGIPIGLVGFVITSLVAVPVTLLILVSALVFGPITGALVALTGATLSALAGYQIGKYTGRGTVERLAGGRLERISQRLARRGILTIVTVRIVPVAPFAVINLFAGASHVRLRDFLIGTTLGMLPGVLALAIFARGITSLIGQASLQAVALTLVGLLALGGLIWLGRHLLRSDQ
jgi:phospholipase D1/2